MRISRWTRTGVVLAVAVALALPVSAADWEIGDVVVGVSGGRYQIYDRDGNFKETITGGTGFTTGCAFDVDGNLYTTFFSSAEVVKFAAAHPHGVLTALSSSARGATSPESIVFDQAGNFYVGHAGFNYNLLKYDDADGFLTNFAVARGPRGTDWIDLAADQETMFYTSEGRRVFRYDVATSTQLTDFATLPGPGVAYALRLLPPGDGSGGLLVADSGDVKRLDGSGAVIQTYDAPGENTWFALNLDADGTSFWSGNFSTGNFYRFDIATGAILTGPINTGTGGNTLFGICVLGEITAGVNNPASFTNPECGTTIGAEVGEEVVITATASDDPTQDLTLDATQSSEIQNFTYDPPVPTNGNPVSTTFTWTPDASNENSTVVVIFTASDGQRESTCRVEIEIGEDLLIVLRSFDAKAGDGEVVLDWSTELEIDNAGFNLFRRDVVTGEVVQVNEHLIPAKGDVFQGASYSYVDTTAVNGVEYEYVLVDLDLSGVETRHLTGDGSLVVNPTSPRIKLASPEYGATLGAEDLAAFRWAPKSLRPQILSLSIDPTFSNADDQVDIVVRGSRGRDRFGLDARDLARIQELAAANVGRPLYWRVTEPTVGSTVLSSDVFRVHLDAGSLLDSAPQSAEDGTDVIQIGDEGTSVRDDRDDGRFNRLRRGVRESRR